MEIKQLSCLRLIRRVAAALMCTLAIPSAHALTTCVKSSDQLLAALSVASFQSDLYRIKIVAGAYVLNSDIHLQPSYPMVIEGGYDPTCSSRVSKAANTIIQFGPAGSGNGFYVYMSEGPGAMAASIEIDGLTFRYPEHFDLSMGSDFFDEPGAISMRRVHIEGDASVSNAGFHLGAATDEIHIENSLITEMGSAQCGVSIRVDDSARVLLNHVTFANPAGVDVCLGDSGEVAQIDVYNSILWSVHGYSPMFRVDAGVTPPNSSTQIRLVNSLYPGVVGGGAQVVQLNASNADPKFNFSSDPSRPPYSLRTQTSPLSPAINTGNIIVPGGELATDIEGDQRVIGSAPDRGAYESPVNNLSTVFVTTTADSGAGSLREAINQANSTPAIPKTIKFDIRNVSNVPVCPAVIALDSRLPDISSTVFIDGTSQPGSTANTDSDAFNAKLCVMIKSSGGSLPVGLRVPSTASALASLSLRGVGMGGFLQSMLILGGGDHLVAGNQFGGTANGVNLPDFDLFAISLGVNAGGNLQIGGPNNADRNVISGGGYAGVNIQSTVLSSTDRCQVINNLIGLSPSGTTAVPNFAGVYLGGSGCAVTANRIAGNTAQQIYVSGSNNLIQRNQLGLTVGNGGVLNDAIGVQVVNGVDNAIGSITDSGAIYGNTIRYNGAGGVVVQGDGASGNAIRSNRIYDNGTSGNGIDIDLRSDAASAGVTDNDAGDADTGPNGFQNFPVATSLLYANGSGTSNRAATLYADLDAAPGNYKIEAYYSQSANPWTGRGHAQTLLKVANVSIAAGASSFFLDLIVPEVAAGAVISLTATDALGNTSEIGPGIAVLATAPPPQADLIFIGGFE